ncbi:MAG: hypothetical protein IGR93_14790 [Hydrococcus sp. C42_A2020_068]|uniref:hypothetical protein n=1 Tax=Pleurocapsa sp. PCC 7327 TaxID=118163 RepID=UPI00029F8AAE|nr:hypothetical protein [Pleurocapsa sp. PCC 7327]AFY79753.1 hypothetical protein Ple7327_4662 [Pleurocapsa sp. PCC 7327]MBF2021328.1 hypothetical protein [Hydrococcus sp. C42_A2020_068]
MIEISVDSQVSFSRPLVYSTYRDKLVELGPYLPNVRSLQLKSRQETERQVRLVLEWHGGGDIPAAARTLLSEKLFAWTEYDVWDNNEFTVDWRIETHAYREAVFCAGKNRFLDRGNYTLVESRAEVRIDLSAIDGIPPFWLGRLVNLVEELLSKKIEPNLVRMGQNVQKYLEQTQKIQSCQERDRLWS